jgi:hypothetical protein
VRSYLSSSVTSRSAIRTSKGQFALMRPIFPERNLCYAENIGQVGDGTTGGSTGPAHRKLLMELD